MSGRRGGSRSCSLMSKDPRGCGRPTRTRCRRRYSCTTGSCGGVIESHYGCVFTTADDSFASAFARASDAVAAAAAAAAAAQQELAAAASPGPVLRAELTRRGRD